jgi:hypothetical protein
MDTAMPVPVNRIIPLPGRLVSVIALTAGILSAQLLTAVKDPAEEVLARAFHTERDSQAQVPLSVAVTFLPSCYPESKLVIRFRSMTQADVEYVQAKLSSREAVQKLRTQAGSDVDAAVALMGIERSRKSIAPETAMAWLAGLRAAVSDLLDGGKELVPGHLVHLDGTLYRLEYLGATRVSVTTDGCEVSTDCAHDTPLVRWMDGLRREVETLVKGSAK